MILLSAQARQAMPVGRSRSWVVAHVLHNILRCDADGFLLRRCYAQGAVLALKGHLSVGRVEGDFPVQPPLGAAPADGIEVKGNWGKSRIACRLGLAGDRSDSAERVHGADLVAPGH
eukprot:2685237-Pyramimonas_sp.AAC.1